MNSPSIYLSWTSRVNTTTAADGGGGGTDAGTAADAQGHGSTDK